MKKHSPSKHKFVEPNTTQTPNSFFDRVLKMPVTLAELKIICAIIRHTYGWWEKSFELSIQDLCELTGLAEPNVQRAAKRLAEGSERLPKLISRKRKGKQGTYSYSLLMDFSESATHATWGALPMQHGVLDPMQHGSSKEERNSIKQIRKKSVVSSSPKEPMRTIAKVKSDDDFKSKS